ncbi:MAG TPA: ABC transporter permease [Actinomycetota bacterium]|nr:ABC transporter permease [Actinomycetota bacterium]
MSAPGIFARTAPVITYAARRLALVPIVLFGMLLLVFTVSQLVPVDPVAYFLGSRQEALGPQSEAVVEALERRWGWDKPIYERFVIYVSNIVQGDLGESSSTRRPVIDDLIQFVRATLELIVFTLIVALAIAIPLGIVAAHRRGRIVDTLFNVITVVGVSTPSFWLALLSLNLFYGQLGWAAGAGRLDVFLVEPPRVTGFIVIDSILAGRLDALVNALHHLALPVGILGLVIGVYYARVVRTEMIEALDSDFTRTAIGKGLSDRAVLYGHALRNALTSTITLTGLSFGSLMTGAIVVEAITGWPGLGSYTFRVTTRLDLPAIAGVALTVGLIYMLLNLIVDLLYAVADPRVRVR